MDVDLIFKIAGHRHHRFGVNQVLIRSGQGRSRRP